jgi:flavin reductase
VSAATACAGVAPLGSANADRVRRAAGRRLATGVTVLTVAHGGTAHGTTASAVGLVSTDPLLVHACLRQDSVFADLARRSGRFAVSVLSERQTGLADWFADPARPAGNAQFARVDWDADAVSGAPLLRHAVSWLSCLPAAWHPGGSHVILLAEVAWGAVGSGSPLLSFDGRLHGAELHHVIRRRGHAAPSIVTLD